MKLAQLLEAKQGLEGIGKAELPTATAWKIARLLLAMRDDEKAYNDEQMKLFKRHGDEKDGKITVRPGEMAAFQSAVTGLLGVEVPFTSDIKINIKELDGARVQGIDLVRAALFIEADA